MPVTLNITTLKEKYQDYRDGIPGDSYNWGSVINANDIKYFALHHSVTKQTAKNDGNWKAECDYIANLHINSRGWDGVGYRFIICSDGTVAYVGDLSRGGSAVGGNNHIILSACFVGDFTKELPTAQQVHSAHELVKWFLTQMPQYPNLNGWEDLIGHQDAYNIFKLPGAEATACPGSGWRAAGDSLRDRVINDTWQGYPNSDKMPQSATPTPPVPPAVPTPPVSNPHPQANGYSCLYEKEKTDLTGQLSITSSELFKYQQLVMQATAILYGKGRIATRYRSLQQLIPKV